MAENSKIEWTDHTFNPWVGCTKVSPACDHCYAESWAKRAGQSHLWNGERRRTTPANWRQPLKWNAQAEKEGRRARVFCASLADIFDNEVPHEWRTDLFRLIYATPHLDWLLLTKRIGNVPKALTVLGDDAMPPNVWLGATVVTQAEVDRDVPKLIVAPARVRFLSCEPLIEEISFAGRWVDHPNPAMHENWLERIDWVIVGGESGSKARPMAQQWVESIREQCAAFDVAFFMKQGSAANWPAYKDFDRFGDSIRVREWPNATL